MQDKIVKLLNLKIDDINQNIENLNYLNDELNKNQENLDYVSNNINIFDNDILNIDSISKDDFNKLLSMVDSDVSLIFEDKTCNYQGILYIIEGIRKGISLELTKNQEEAIIKFLEALKNLQDNLNTAILNLNENKKRLPEIDLTVLEKDLVDYQEIVDKFNENKYLTEIEKILEVVEFNNITIEEKIEIFAYLLKYNRDIYEKNKIEVVEEEKEEYINLPEIDVTSLNYEPIDEEIVESVDNNKNDIIGEIETNSFNIEDIIQKIDMKLKEIEENEQVLENETVEHDSYFDDVEEILPSNLEEETMDESETIECEDLSSNILDNTLETKAENDIDMDNILPTEVQDKETLDFSEKQDLVDNLENTEVLPEINDEIEHQINVNLEENNVDFEELNEVEDNEIVLNNNLVDETLVNELVNKYNLENINKENINDIEESDKLLNYLVEINLLDKFKENNLILNEVLKNNNVVNLSNLINIIKQEFALNEKNTLEILSIFIDTLPILFTNTDIVDIFVKNIEFFKKYQINLINLFDNYRELFIVDTIYLENNKTKIEAYNLKLDNDNVKYLLCNKKILENLDYYIEANGHEKGFLGKEAEFNGIEYIKKYPYKLNNISMDTLIKLRYSSENNLKIYGNKPGILAGEIANSKVNLLNISDEYKNLYFNYEYEFIDRSDLFKLMEKINNTHEFDLSIDSVIEKLDALYKVDDLRYKINDLYFSRNKTIRLYNYLKKNNLALRENLIISLTYNSVIKKDEYINIENTITSLIGEGVNN